MRIGNGRDHRLLGQVDPGTGIKCVEVWLHHGLHVRRWERGNIGERVHRRVNALGLDRVRQLLSLIASAACAVARVPLASDAARHLEKQPVLPEPMS